MSESEEQEYGSEEMEETLVEESQEQEQSSQNDEVEEAQTDGNRLETHDELELENLLKNYDESMGTIRNKLKPVVTKIEQSILVQKDGQANHRRVLVLSQPLGCKGLKLQGSRVFSMSWGQCTVYLYHVCSANYR